MRLLSLVIPFFNEEENVSAVVEPLVAELKAEAIPHELVLVDNGSWDATRQRLQAIVQAHPTTRLVVVERNIGYGWGVLEGLRQAHGEVLGFMVGDGQVQPASVVQVYQKLIREDLALCKAARIVRHDGWQRAILTKWGNRMFHWQFPALQTSDINGSPKLLTRPLYERLRLSSHDWFLDAETVIKASVAGVPMGEVDVESPPRRSGKSHVRFSTVAEFLVNLWRYRWGGVMAPWGHP